MLKLPEPTMKPTNPVFRFEMARGRGLIQPQHFNVYSRWVIGITLGSAVIWWGVLLIRQFNYAMQVWNNLSPSAYRNGNPATLVYPYVFNFYSSAVSNTLIVAGIVALAISLIADGWSMILTVVNISRQVNSGHWDLLKLTPLPKNMILEGLCVAAEVRSRPLLVLEIAVRIATIGFVILSVWLPAYWIVEILHGDYLTYPMFGALTASLPNALVSITLLTSTLMLSAAYVWEPLWRMRLMVAVGLAISSRVRSESAAVIVSAATLLMMRATQAVVLVLSLLPLTIVLFPAFILSLDRPTPRTIWLLIPILVGVAIWCAAVIAVNRAYYQWLKGKALFRLWLWAFRPE